MENVDPELLMELFPFFNFSLIACNFSILQFIKYIILLVANEYQWTFWITLTKVSIRFLTRIQCTTLSFMMVEKMRKLEATKKFLLRFSQISLKTFQCIRHGLLVAKLNALAFDKKWLSFLSYNLYIRKKLWQT